ncbi:hypothetical protein NCC78_06340 [Micromonospora phytophila]|uniref:hypothetical protein n=1 Tax=Micromonospora phytophila TaxID=709888 RepID=UPI0020307A3D|nr:hypothetical protein [Micromonospora phytophila]MCM0674307.1 hypothetical protein [Micromonospora phytophila]
MRHGVWLRRGLVAAVAVGVLAVLGVVVGLPVLRDRSQQRLEDRADREVSATAQRVRAGLLADRAGGESTLRRVAEAVDGVEVLTVQGVGARPDAGARLFFRVRVTTTAASIFGWQRAESAACFAQLVPADARPAALERVPCPA